MRRVTASFLCLVLASGGCIRGQAGPLASDSKSSQSEGSANSSDQSGDSSNTSKGSSDSSKSENNSLEKSSEDSSRESSKDSSDKTSSKGDGTNNAGPVLTTAGVLLTGTAVGVLIWIGTRAPPEQRRVAAQTTRHWLVANRHQLALDFGLGAGPALDDLAGAAGISPKNVKTFGRVLRRNRQELLAIAEPGLLTDERALEFLQRVGQVSRGEPRLAAEYQRFVDNWNQRALPQDRLDGRG